jgi:hypothetical protein
VSRRPLRRTRPGLARRLVIPGGLKWEVLDKPDGLNLWLRRQYA